MYSVYYFGKISKARVKTVNAVTQIFDKNSFFSVVHEHQLQEYSKYRAYQKLFKITHDLNKKINLLNSLLCSSVTLLIFIQTVDHRFGACHKWEPACRIGDAGNVPQMSPQMSCIKSIKGCRFTQHQICWQDFLKLVERKKFGLICFPRSIDCVSVGEKK